MIRKTTGSLVFIVVLLLICFLAYVAHNTNYNTRISQRNTQDEIESVELGVMLDGKMYLTDEEYLTYEKKYRNYLFDGCMRTKMEYKTLFSITREFLIRNKLRDKLDSETMVERFLEYTFTWNPIFQIQCGGNTRERDMKIEFTKLMDNLKFLSMFEFDDERTKEILNIHFEYLKLPRNERYYGTHFISELCPMFQNLYNHAYNIGSINNMTVKAACVLTEALMKDEKREDFLIDYVVVSTVGHIMRKYEYPISSVGLVKEERCESSIGLPTKMFMNSFCEKWQLNQYGIKISNFYSAALDEILNLELDNITMAASNKMKNIKLSETWKKDFCNYDAYLLVKNFPLYGNLVADTYTLDEFKSQMQCHEGCVNKFNFFTSVSHFDGQNIYFSPYFMKRHGFLENNSITPEQIISLSIVFGDELCYALKYYDTSTTTNKRISKFDEECVGKRKPLARKLVEKYSFTISDEKFETLYAYIENSVRESKSIMSERRAYQ